MKVTFVELAGASGSKGGTTYARNRGGNYARKRVAPVNPRTIWQTQARANAGALASAWRDVLTDGQRAAWEAYADTINETDSLGQPIRWTGLNAYLAGNSRRLLAGLDRIDDAPTLSGKATLLGGIGEWEPPRLMAGGGGLVPPAVPRVILVLFAGTWADQEGGVLLVSLSDPVSPARNYRVPRRFAGSKIRGVDPIGPAFDVVLDPARHSPLVPGQRRQLEVVAVDAQGRPTGTYSTTVVVEAEPS